MGKPVSNTTIREEKTFKISLRDFDSEGDIEMTGYVGTRGKEKYVQPPRGWKRKGLNVIKKFDNGDETWLETNDNAWPVAYHGIRHFPDFAISKIIKGGLRSGHNNAYTDKPAIYCSPSFDYVLRNFSSPI